MNLVAARGILDDGLLSKPLRHLPLSTIKWRPSHPKSFTSTRREISDVQEKIRSIVADREWLLDDDQPVRMPQTSLADETKPIFTLNDFLIQQDEKLAKDALESSQDERGDGMRPSAEQMKELERSGKISVPSRNFEDQEHIWEVSTSFYSGRERNYHRFRAGLGSALDYIVVRERDAALSDEKISLSRAFKRGLFRALQCLWKNLKWILPLSVRPLDKYTASDIDDHITEAESVYVNHHMRKIVPGFCHRPSSGRGWVPFKDQWENLSKDAAWGGGYFPQSASEENSLRSRVHDKLRSATEEVDRKLDRRRVTELDVNADRLRKSPVSALRERAAADKKWTKLVTDELITALFGQEDPILQAEASRLYCEKLKADLVREDEQKRKGMVSEKEKALRNDRPIVSLSPLWMSRRLGALDAEIAIEQQSTFEPRLLDRLRKDENEIARVAIEYLNLTIKFREAEAPQIETAMRAQKKPNPPKVIAIPRWRYGGQDRQVKVPYEQPFWRAKIFVHTFVAAFANMAGGAFRFLLSGSLSLRALFSVKPFFAQTGREETLTPTLISRLQDFFRTLRKIRSDFERTPDLSLIGKTIQRNFLKCYLAAKGIIGSVLISGFMVVGSMLATVLSAAVLVLSPALAAALMLLRVAFDLLFYDSAAPCPRIGAIAHILVGVPYFLLVPGVFQGVGALGILVFYPLLASMQTAWSSLRHVWSSLRDALTWPIISRHAKTPAVDTFLARRIHGPGLTSEHMYRMPIQQAFEAVQALLDYFRLGGYAEMRRAEILTPSKQLKNTMQSVVQPFGFQATGARGPEGMSSALVSSWQSEGRMRRGRQEDSPVLCHWDAWDTIAHRLRSAHPSHHYQARATKPMLQRFDAFDKRVSSWLETEQRKLKQQDCATIHCVMSTNAAIVLTKLTLQSNFREQRLLDICGLPPEAVSKFRLPEDEVQMLWEATISLTQQYADGIRRELLALAYDSEQNATLVPLANKIADTFWTDAGARAGQDVEIVAAHILSLAFGGALMLEPMEMVDKRLLLVPKMSEEDKHLDFFGTRDDSSPEYTIPADTWDSDEEECDDGVDYDDYDDEDW